MKKDWKIALFLFLLLLIIGGIIMANYNIQMKQRNDANTEWDNLYPITKPENIVNEDGTTVQDQLSELPKFNVMSYGAKGDWDGTTGTDDTAAIQATINAAYEAGNGVVVFPSGEKFLAKNIVLKSGITIQGNGSSIINNSTSVTYENPTFLSDGNATTTKTTLSSDLPGGAHAGYLPVSINVANSSSFSIGDNIEIWDSNGKEFNIVKSISGNTITLKSRPVRTYSTAAGGKITKINLIKDITMQNLRLEHINAVDTSIVAKYTINTNFSDIIIAGGERGVTIENSEGITIDRCRISTAGINADTSSRCITIESTSRHCKVTNSTLTYGRPAIFLLGKFCTISNNNIIASGRGYSGDGITLPGSDNVISNNTIVGGDCYGIWVVPSVTIYPQRNIISNNVIEANITTGVYLNGGADHIVTGNIFRQNSVGVAVNESTGCTVTNNTIVDCSNMGIALFSTRTIVTGNRIKSNVNYSLYMYADADYSIIKDNIMDGNGGLVTNTKTHNIIKDNILNGVITP